ncbi:hypothetical protein QNM97_10315 [Gordonia sp. L191]|uniref:hypothetical protein n=1 Tax=Gordonia sp. L191 TaxID=2982699 RepID=UPI0024BF4284|nr:hypothetical protein [Gordonia sp. L191]WHU49327.1 hypothetical protein QNM97_10315 [Gordonia sp. L191]
MTGVLVLALLAVMVALTTSTPPAGAETPAERCARETAAYNQTWKQGWVATHPGKSISDAPAPTPPYVCQDPATQTPTTTQPSVTAPSMPTTTTPGPGGAPNINAHGATDIPTPGTTPIVPVPGRAPTTAEASPTIPTSPSGTSGPTSGPPVGDSAEPVGDSTCSTGAQAPDTPVNAGIVQGGVPGPEGVAQGSLNDCWVLATVMGYQLSSKGREGLARMVVPSPRGGYDVHLTVNGKCETKHVDRVYGSGATDNGTQGIDSIIESAVSQVDENAVECAGGYPQNAQSLMSGSGSEHHSEHWWTNKMADRLTNDSSDINSKIANGSSVVVGTGGKEDKKIGTSIIENGKVKDGLTYSLKGGHAYVVTRASSDGIWVKNPWGPFNKLDHGNEFFIPKDQIDDDFTDVSISAPISDSGCF